MPSYADILFGRIVLKNRLASHAQVNECLLRAQPGQSLGEAMIERRLLRPEQARKVQRAQALMQFMRAERTFARILLDRRMVDLDTLRKCFEMQEQQRYKVRIAQILMERGRLSPEQNEAIVDEQLMKLAEETARIEEQGLNGAAGLDQSQTQRHKGVDKLSGLHKIEDLDNSTHKKAVGPKGLFDAPSPELVRRTLPVMKAVRLDDGDGVQPRRTILINDDHDPEDSRAETQADGDGLVGRTIASRYRILSKVGEGGMGTVYKAEHCLMEKIVALKVLHPTLLSSKASLDRFRIEIRAASRFQHKNVIQIYDAGEGEGGIFYMAMEFAKGETLEDIIQSSGALDVDTTLRYLRQALQAVGEAHKKKIIHRDLKSGNLIITRDKNGEQIVKVMDFGIAKFAFDEESGIGEVGGGLYRTQEGIVTGTPQYMSPEQASGEKVDHRSDLYSIGVILFEMLTGELPFKSNTPMGFLGKHIVEPPPRPSSVKPGLPVVLEEVTLKLLEKKPDDRYQSAEDALADLEVRCSDEQLKVVSSSDASHLSSSSRPPALTVAVAPPTDLGPGPAPEKPVGIGRTIVTPAPSDPGGEEPKKKTWVVAAGLIVLLLAVVSISTTLAIYLSKDGGGGGKTHVDPAQALSNAKILLKSGDPQGAIDALELVEEPTPEIEAVLAEARELLAKFEEAASLAQSAQKLDEGFRSGTAGRESANEALRQYKLSLELHEDPDVRRRFERLEERLAEADEPDIPDASQGLTLLLEGTEALQRGDRATAKSKLEEARKLLPSGHKALRGLDKHLRAEELIDQGKAARKAGELSKAQRKLEEALPLHPDAQTQARIKSQLEEIKRSLALNERRGAIDVELKRSLAAAAELDLTKAEEALAKAILVGKEVNFEDPRTAQRRRGLAALARFADRMLAAEERLAGMERKPRGVTSDDVQDALSKLRANGTEIDRVAKADPDLGAALKRRLEETLRKGADFAKRIDAMQEQFKSEQLKRFERSLKRLRKPVTGRETLSKVRRRLGAFLDLQEHPAYVDGECTKTDRAYVDETVKGLQHRQAVWLDLVPDGSQSADMVQIPGGKWTSPEGKEYELPEVYYMSVNEVTCAEWYRFMKATGAPRPSAFPGPTDEPVRFVSLRDVNTFCRWRSRNRRVTFRLPTEPEWERAARGTKGTKYPWGDAFEDWRDKYAAVDGKLSKIQRFTRDKNDFGLWDLVGNVREMTTLFGSPGKIVLRGGSAASKRSNTGADFRKPIRSGQEVSGYTGFRLLAVE